MTSANVDESELAKFSSLAHRWWDTTGEFAPLHQINPLRLDWIDGIVIGMETLEQLNDNLKLITKPPLDQSQLVEVNNTRPALNESSLNPAMWKTRTP